MTPVDNAVDPEQDPRATDDGGPTAVESVTTVIAGGGPAGLMLGFLLARQGIDVLVLEKHGDFLRDFRGDTIHPSTLELLQQLRLADRFLELPHSKAYTVDMQLGTSTVTVADFRRLRSRYRYLAFVPQWDFLNFITAEARRLAAFRIEMRAEALELLVESGAVRGLRYVAGDRLHEVHASLTVAADGRGSRLTRQAGLALRGTAPPMDVLWFRLSRGPAERENLTLRVAPGRILLFINRRDYWQVAYVIRKGGADGVRGRGIEAFRDDVARLKPEMADRVHEIADWDHVKLLTVQSNRLTRWYRPGFLAIGDAAHAMSPVGGVGINLAIQDAAAAANVLGPRLVSGELSERDLRRVQRSRELPTMIIQRFQKVLQERVIAATLGRPEEAGEMPLPRPVRFLQVLPPLTGLTARLIGLGVRRERLSERALRMGVSATQQEWRERTAGPMRRS